MTIFYNTTSSLKRKIDLSKGLRESGEDMMQKSILYYFTGSGNTEKIAMTARDTFVQQGYDCALYRMEEVTDLALGSYDYIGILFPVAIQSTYPLVWDFVEMLPKGNRQKIFMIDTMEQFSGGVVGPMKKLLQNKGYDCVGALEVKMFSSMQTKKFDREEARRKNSHARRVTEDFIIKLLKGQTRWDRVPVLSDMMRHISAKPDIWIKTSQKISVVHEACVGCNLCVRTCPTGSLTNDSGRIRMNHLACNACMRCVHHCPKDAFRVSGNRIKRLNQ